MTKIKFRMFSFTALALSLAPCTFAQEPSDGALDPLLVKSKKSSEGSVSAKLNKTRDKTAGAVSTVSPEEIELQSAGNLGDIYARIPGINYIDEDGRGTKPNIGLRGLPPIRSEYLQILNNGVPTQPSVYSEQAGYYGVPAERVSGIEVIKGGASILYGPNTVGGVVNLISRAPSDRPFSAILESRVSTYGDQQGNLFLSGTQGKFSYGVEYMKKNGDGFRDSLGFDIDNFEGTFKYQITPQDSVALHFLYYDERSETPGGLMPFQSGNPEHSNKPNDEFYGKRTEVDLRTVHQLTANQKLETLTYAYRFQRNWFLQDYVNKNDASLTLADSNGQYLREFDVFGFEPRYTLNYDLGGMTDNELILGGRVYFDSVNRRVATGNAGDSRESDGVLKSEDDLTTRALAVYAQNEFKLTDAFSVVPGIRYENIKQTRKDTFNGGPRDDKSYDIVVPGLGMKYKFGQQSLAYANVTKSFRPPSFKSSFNPATGASNFDLDASTAVTYEVGVRMNPYPWFALDAGVFYTQFDDQVIISGGTASNFDTITYGFEGNGQLGLIGFGKALQGDRSYDGDHEIFLRAGATILDASFDGGAFDGNDIPYVADNTFTFGVMYDYRDKFNILFQGRYADSRFTDSANTKAENLNGTVGQIDSYTVFDLKARWQVSETVSVSAGVNNIFDESYGTQRRTGGQKGLFPGATREGYVSVKIEF